MSPRFHHVANGSSTTDLIERAGLAGTRSLWADPLDDGPVPAGLADRELLGVRSLHLAAGEGVTAAEVADELTRWRSAIADTTAYDELVLWYEHDLFDQLNLIQLVDWLSSAIAGSGAVTLISIGGFPGRPAFRGLGELTPSELGSLFPSRRPLAAAQYAVAQRAWCAFRSPDPREIESLLASDTAALPFLSSALRRHLEELPSADDGLARSERRLLELARAGPIDIRKAFGAVSRGETAFFLSDRTFWRRIESLRYSSPALIESSEDESAAPRGGLSLPRGTITLTDAGRALLGGGFDRVARCGIDRWLGGVHLEGRGPTWRWDRRASRVVER
jgi:hypothetical protein